MDEFDRNGTVGSRRVARLKAKVEQNRSVLADRPRRAIGYVHGGSACADDESALRASAADQGFDLIAVIREAAGDGKAPREDRPGLNRVYDAARKRSFGTLLVCRASDLTRDSFDAAMIAGDLFDISEVVIRSVSEPQIDTGTAAGRLALVARCSAA